LFGSEQLRGPRPRRSLSPSGCHSSGCIELLGEALPPCSRPPNHKPANTVTHKFNVIINLKENPFYFHGAKLTTFL
jgi:hypothetical protein